MAGASVDLDVEAAVMHLRGLPPLAGVVEPALVRSTGS